MREVNQQYPASLSTVVSISKFYCNTIHRTFIMSQISRLVAEITEKARIIDAELERSKQVLPNDDVWSQLEFPNLGPQAAVARGELLSLIHQLDKTIQSPVEYFRNLSQAVS